jgi:(p)ppGpp synthase/HD superfamily hydrolase
MSTLERAIAIAAEAHAGQFDKAGSNYILHPLRVMLKVSTIEERIVAVLHDVCEDCPGWSLQRLRSEGFSEEIISAISSVTKRPEEDGDNGYFRFVRRAASNPIGRRVKLADLQDNLDITRIVNPTKRDHDRLERYRKAIDLIQRLEADERV